MERKTLIANPPLYPTPYRPEDIIGRENLDVFTSHLRICLKENNGEFPVKSLNREFGKESKEIRSGVARVLQELRDKGFYPIDINESGKIVWGIVTKSASHIEFEKHLPEYQGKTFKELREMAVNGYVKIRDRKDIDNVEKWQEQFEEAAI